MINTVTLNPAMDEILYIESFQENCMNRIQKKKKMPRRERDAFGV